MKWRVWVTVQGPTGRTLESDSSEVEGTFSDVLRDLAAQSLNPMLKVVAARIEQVKEVGTGTGTGTLCSVCREPQFKTEHGDVCENGHGGAPPL